MAHKQVCCTVRSGAEREAEVVVAPTRGQAWQCHCIHTCWGLMVVQKPVLFVCYESSGGDTGHSELRQCQNHSTG